MRDCRCRSNGSALVETVIASLDIRAEKRGKERAKEGCKQGLG